MDTKKLSVVSICLAVVFSAVLAVACLFPKKAEQVVNVAAERTMQAAEQATGAVVEFHPRLRNARIAFGVLANDCLDAKERLGLKDVEIKTLGVEINSLKAELGTAVADGAEALASAARWEGRYKGASERLARIRSLVQSAATEDVVGQ